MSGARKRADERRPPDDALQGLEDLEEAAATYGGGLSITLPARSPRPPELITRDVELGLAVAELREEQ